MDLEEYTVAIHQAFVEAMDALKGAEYRKLFLAVQRRTVLLGKFRRFKGQIDSSMAQCIIEETVSLRTAIAEKTEEVQFAIYAQRKVANVSLAYARFMKRYK